MYKLTLCLCLLATSVACANAADTAPKVSGVGATQTAPKQNNRYLNPHAAEQHGSLWSFLKARFRSGEWADYEPEVYQVPVSVPQLAESADPDNQATVTWLGHASVLLQHQGINVLTDPMLSRYASPLSFVGPKRYTQPALRAEELPPIDLVVISHDHYDHLDKPSIRALGNVPRYLVPLGLKAWLVGQGIAAERVLELDWWQAASFEIRGRRVTLTATPAQHFSGRGLTNRNKTLWASWLIGWDDFRAWFGGDTGYNAVQFKAIGQRFPNIDVGIIPIGAYAPRWFMGTVHIDPSEAVKVHQDIGATRSFGVHWGAFLLSAEPVGQPPELLRAAMEASKLSPPAFDTYAIGESRRYPVGANSSLSTR